MVVVATPKPRTQVEVPTSPVTLIVRHGVPVELKSLIKIFCVAVEVGAAKAKGTPIPIKERAIKNIICVLYLISVFLR